MNAARAPFARTPAAIAVALASAIACSSSGGASSARAEAGSPPVPSPPAHAVGGFEADIPAMTLQPGDELEPCFIVPLVRSGPSRMVGGSRLDVGVGMHHGNIIARKKTGDGVRPCPPGTDDHSGGVTDVLNGDAAVLFASTTQITGTEWMSFPDGMAYRVPDDAEIVAYLHYLNATEKPITVAPVYRWYTVDESSVTTPLAPFAWANEQFSIPPKSVFTASTECHFPETMHIVTGMPHMHAMGQRFTATYVGGPHDGEPFFDSPGYTTSSETLIRTFAPAVELPVGVGVRYACTWKNPLDTTITWGVGQNEMCIFFGYAYPIESAYTAKAAGDGCVYVAAPTPN